MTDPAAIAAGLTEEERDLLTWRGAGTRELRLALVQKGLLSMRDTAPVIVGAGHPIRIDAKPYPVLYERTALGTEVADMIELHDAMFGREVAAAILEPTP